MAWPTLLDWFGGLVYAIVGVMSRQSPAGRSVSFRPCPRTPRIGQLLTAISIGIFFPIIFLSQLDIGTPLGIVSGRVVSSMAKCPFSWAFFYLECAMIAAICFLVTVLAVSGPAEVVRTITFRGQAINFMGSPFTLVWLLPLYVLALIIAARLLGRLGWRLSESIPLDEKPKDDEDEPRPRGSKNYNPPRQTRNTT